MNDEQKKFVELNYLGKTTNELCDLLNKNFNSNINKNQIINYKKRKKLRNGVDTKFQKLKKPHNYKPVGTEFVNSEGYTMIKVANPNNWQLKHRYLYEKRYSKIPKNHSVIFANGDKNDFSENNLILVEEKEKLVMKNKHLIFEDQDLTNTGLLISKMIIKNAELEKREDK